MKKCLSGFIVTLFLFSYCLLYAEENKEIFSSRFGDVILTTVNETDEEETELRKFTIKNNGNLIYEIDYPGISSLSIDKIFKVKDKDILLVSFWDGGNLNPNEYFFIELNSSGYKKSRSFYAPDISVINFKKYNNKIIVNYKYPIKGFNYAIQRPPVIWDKGEIVVKDKLVKNGEEPSQ